MKSETEIRRHLRDLYIALSMPCDCRESGHAAECAEGGRLMKMTASVLSWVLGENEAMQSIVDGLAEINRMNDPDLAAIDDETA